MNRELAILPEAVRFGAARAGGCGRDTIDRIKQQILSNTGVLGAKRSGKR